MPGKFHGQTGAMQPWGRKELDTAEQLTLYLGHAVLSQS